MSYKDIKNATAEASSGYLPCRVCQKSTLISTLSEYGARCFACYEEYCRTPVPVAASIAAIRK